MIEIDELDMLRKRSEKVIWRAKPIWSWKFSLFVILLGVAAATIKSLIYVDGLLYFLDVVGILLIAAITGWGGTDTMITENRILQLGRRRGFWGGRQDPPYSVSLSELSNVSLQENGIYLRVGFRIAGSDRVDVLQPYQPQAFAAAIADSAGLTGPAPIGRLEHFAKICSVFGFALYWIIKPWIEGRLTGPLGLDLGSGLLTWDFAVFPMPYYASAEEAANWFRLRPRTRLFRWLGWKSRPYVWLARLVYRRDLKVCA